nr:ft-interacting protein 1 [Quercus suber]
MQIPTPPEEFSLKETNPHLGGEKVTGYELVEQIQYLYVRVVKAKDLPEKYVTGTCDPYLEVKTGSTKVTTPRFENNWNQVFAISKDRVQSSVIEVIVKDKDIENANNAFMGRVSFELNRVPRRVPPDNPLAPQWYSFDNDRGKKVEGELMLAVWTGTQADEAFSEAWCSDAFGVSGTDDIANIRSRVYFSPKLSYVLKSRISPRRTVNPLWNEDLIFVVAEPFDEPLILSVEDRVAPDKDELLGRCKIPFQDVDWRLDYFKPSVIRSYELETHVVTEGDQEEETKFASRILVCICLEGGYHVLDESTKYCSDFRPTAEELRRPKIGVLELGILEAKELAPMKTKDEVGTTDAYCVAKYGDKSRGLKDSRIGKVRIRLSTLETNRVYTHLYPLLVLHPSGVKKMGEIHLALDYLRHQATQIISMRLSLTEPPLRKEVVEYILDVGSYMWKLILPAIFLCPFLIGAWYYRQRPRYPPHIDVRPSHAESAIPDDLDEEFDTLPTSRSSDLVRMRYDHLRGIAGRIQTVVDDVASQGERLLSLLSWRDPRATALYMIIHLVAAIVVYVTPFKVVTLLTGFYVLRHPRFRRRRWLPSIESILMNFFKRLPARTDCIL